jgi:xanthine dehydrogenase/oxidase
MDEGALNLPVDIGQIEGAFVQGYRWCTVDMIWGRQGVSVGASRPTLQPWPRHLKIPGFNDVPVDFRVTLAATENPYAVHSPKAVGEPPFVMGCSTFFTIKVRA